MKKRANFLVQCQNKVDKTKAWCSRKRKKNSLCRLIEFTELAKTAQFSLEMSRAYIRKQKLIEFFCLLKKKHERRIKLYEAADLHAENVLIVKSIAAWICSAANSYGNMDDMYQAQKFFNEAVTATVGQDSLYNLALKGGEGKLGLVDIADQYSGTAAGNLANYYAGMAYLNTKKYQEAIDYLDEFESEDEALAPLAKGAIGDAYAQTNEKSNALDYYKKAANLRQNEFTTPTYLFKAGVTALDMGDASEALELLNKIKDNYPNSPEATQAEVFIGKAQAMSN